MGYDAKVQNSDHFLFKNSKDLAGFATKAGMTVPEFTKLYLDNLYIAKEEAWYTAVRFKAKITNLTIENTAKISATGSTLQRVIMHYQSGDDFKDTNRAPICGLLVPGYPTEEIYEKAKTAIGKEVLLYRVYEKEKYVAIIDLDII